MQKSKICLRALNIRGKSMDNSKGDSYFINEDQLPGITVGVYKAFLKREKDGIEALAVYQHLLFTYSLQHTNQIWATDEYIAKGIHIGLVKVRKCKSILKSMGLIDYIQKRDKGSRFGKTYILLHLLPNPGAGSTEKRPASTISVLPEPADKCLKNKSNATSTLKFSEFLKQEAPEYRPEFNSIFKKLVREQLKEAERELFSDKDTVSYFEDVEPASLKKFIDFLKYYTPSDSEILLMKNNPCLNNSLKCFKHYKEFVCNGIYGLPVKNSFIHESGTESGKPEIDVIPRISLLNSNPRRAQQLVEYMERDD
jgi:hypothetical protein